MLDPRWLCCAALLALSTVWAADRSAAERAAFVRENPCPDTGQRRGACPGWQVDHVKPLCAGGPDLRANMQWIRTEDHRLKSHVDTRECRKLKAAPASAMQEMDPMYGGFGTDTLGTLLPPE